MKFWANQEKIKKIAGFFSETNIIKHESLMSYLFRFLKIK